MIYKVHILFLLSSLCCYCASAQLSNRQKVIDVVLHEPKFKNFETGAQSEALMNNSSTSVMLIPVQGNVPKYSLPKGNVFCRLEDYVQMHTPMKLNIGLAGQ